MSERAPLLSLLRRLRRRLRALAAADGAVRGAAVGLAALAAALAVARWRGGGVGGLRAVALVALAAAAGAEWLGLRRVPLRRCARVIDRALDGQDRVLSALMFLKEPPTALGQAAIADAARRAAGLAPAAVAPTRRPRGLPALAVAALAAGLTGALPARAPAARINRAAASPEAAAAAGMRVPEARLAAEREEAERVAQAASALDDADLAGVARDLAAAVRALSDGTLPRGEALERLQALAERAAEEAAAGERERSAVRAAGRAMEQTAATRDVGAALGGDDPGAAERALQSLAERQGEAGAGERSQVAKAMDAASQQAASADAAAASAQANASAANANAQSESRRRLNRERPASAQNSGAGNARPPGERRLERLKRDLADTASACRENPEACKRKISERAQGDLPRMVGQGRRVEVWKRVEKAARQMRERLRRGDLGDQKTARGERRSRPGGQGQSGDEGDGDTMLVETDNPEEADAILSEEEMDGDPDQAAEAAGQASAAAGANSSGSGASEKPGGQGNGIGNQPGAEPLGRAGQTGGARGSERQATVHNGAGPNRSQVIDAAAQRGFAQRGYGRVFDEYQAVVEEALDSGAVPEGRRYVVRRYFQLIRPRPQARKP